MTPGCLLLLALHGFAHAATVEVDGSRWQALQEVPEPPPSPGIGPIVASREVVLVPVEEGLEVRATWTLQALEPGWFSGVLIGPGSHVTDVRWNDGPAGFLGTPDGTVLAGWVQDRATVSITGFVPGDAVRLLPAVRGTVRLEGERALAADGAPALREDGAWITGAALLAPIPEAPTPAAGPLVLASAGLGLTVGDAEIEGRAHAVWVVRRGTLDAVALRVAGIGQDLDVQGPNVAGWRREGDRVVVDLREPADDRVDVRLSWSTATPAGTETTLPLPRIEPLDAFRTEASVQVAREEGLEVVPRLEGSEAIPTSALPEWGRGLVQGNPSATFRAAGVPSGRLELLRFEPVSLPPVVVDVADYRVATTAEGRVLARAFYEVRNERAPWLRITPPEGWRIVGARVSGDTARPVTDDGPGWLIPLPRSVETVDGLISFAVEVAFLGEEAPFDDHTERDLPLPTVDAEVADWRVLLFLPPGFRNQRKPGEGSAVEEFASGEGVTYGLTVSAPRAAAADALFEDAVGYWLGNEFEAAQTALDDLRAMGAKGDNLELLQSNLDLVSGDRGEEDYAARRIRSMAQARATEEVREQQELEKKAEERQRAGDLKAAKEYYEQALEIGGTLAQLENDEAVEVESRNLAYKSQLEQIDKDAKQREEVLGEAATALPWDVDGEPDWDVDEPPDWDVEGELSWEDEEIEGSGMVVGGAAGAVGDASGSGYGYGSGTVGVGRAYDTTIAAEAKSPGLFARRGHGGGGRRKAKSSSSTRGPGRPDAPLAPPEVHASALSVTVPAVGEFIRYQRLLVPAAADARIGIEARITARERRNR